MRVCMSLQLSACSSLDSVAEGDSSNSGHGHHGHHGHHHHSHHPPPGGLHFARDLQHLSKMFINASMLPRPKSESNFRVRFQLNRISETDAYFTSPQLLIHPSIRAATGRSAVEKDESVPETVVGRPLVLPQVRESALLAHLAHEGGGNHRRHHLSPPGRPAMYLTSIHFSRFFSESSDRKGSSVCPLVC